MTIKTSFLDSNYYSLVEIVIAARHEFYDSPVTDKTSLLVVYTRNMSATMMFGEVKKHIIDNLALEMEMRENFLSSNEYQRLSYYKLLKRRLSDLEIIENEAIEILKKIESDNESNDRKNNNNHLHHQYTHCLNITLLAFANFKDVINEGIEIFHSGFEDDTTKTNSEQGVKLQWNCSPAIAGYIISELVRAGYIEPPKTHGELSYAKLAGVCNQLFDIRTDGRLTTLDYLKKVVNPESNPLPDYKRAKLTLPDLDQLT